MLNELYWFLLSNVHYGNIRFHVWSLLAYALFAFAVFYKLSKYIHPIYSFMIAFVISMIGNDVYETIWQYIMWENGVNSYFAQYLIVDVGMIVLILVINKIFKVFKYNKWFLILLIVELYTFPILYYTGHYVILRQWMITGGLSPDPHNWIWMINKALSVWCLYPLIKSKEIK